MKKRFVAVILLMVLMTGCLPACAKKESAESGTNDTTVQSKDSSVQSKDSTAQSKDTSGDKNDSDSKSKNDKDESNTSTGLTDNPLSKQLQIVILSDSKVNVTLTSEYLSQLESRKNDDGSETSLNSLYIAGYDSNYNSVFSLDFTKWGWNFGAGENCWAGGDIILENATTSFDISVLGIGSIMKKVSMFSMMYNDWHDNPDVPETLMNEDYSAEGVISEQLEAGILSVSFPQSDRVKFTLAKTAEVEASMDPGNYGSISIGLYSDAAALSGYREAVSISMNCYEYEGRTDYTASLNAVKYKKIDEWNYESEWIDLDEFGLRVNSIPKDDSFAIAATMDDIQSLISACSVYQVRDSEYNTIEIGYLKDAFRNESYGSFPAEYADASDADFRFVPHSDSYRLITFEKDEKIPNMRWFEYYNSWGYGCFDRDFHTDKVKYVIFWNNDETGYSNMLCKLIFENEQDRKDFMVGAGKTIAEAKEPNDSLITDELYNEAMKDCYFEGCSCIGAEGNIAYFESDRHYDTLSVFEDYYSDYMEVFRLDLWHDVEYSKDNSVTQNVTLKSYNYDTGEDEIYTSELISFSTY